MSGDELLQVLATLAAVSEDGKAMKFYEVTPFALQLTPQTIMAAVRTLDASSDLDAGVGR